MTKFFRRNKRTIIIVAISVLLSALACSFIGNISDGFTNFEDISLRDRNEDNLLTGTFTDFESGDGVKATGRNDGSILLSGENTSSEAITIPLENVSLTAGTYTISGAPNGGNATYHIAVKYTDGDGATKTAISDFESKTFTLTTTQTVEVSIVVYPDTSVNGVLLKPVLVVGSEKGEFYA